MIPINATAVEYCSEFISKKDSLSYFDSLNLFLNHNVTSLLIFIGILLVLPLIIACMVDYNNRRKYIQTGIFWLFWFISFFCIIISLYIISLIQFT